MTRFEMKIDVDDQEYKVVVTDLVDNRKSKESGFTMNFYVIPRVDDKESQRKINSEINSICNKALKNYERFNKERYE